MHPKTPVIFKNKITRAYAALFFGREVSLKKLITTSDLLPEARLSNILVILFLPLHQKGAKNYYHEMKEKHLL